MDIEKKTWEQLEQINPDFLTGEDYPFRAEFFKAKAYAFSIEFEKLSGKFEKCLSAINQLLKTIKENEQIN